MADPRSERSWQKLADAQIELLLEHPWQPPTVEQVLQRAGVARATFYRHFTDLDALLAWQVERMLDAMESSIDRNRLQQEELFSGRVVRAVLEHALARPAVYRLFVTGQAGAVPMERLFSRFYQASLSFQKQRCAQLGIQPGAPLEIICSSLSGQMIGMLRWLLLSPDEIDLEQAMAWMRRMFLHGFQQFLEPAATTARAMDSNPPTGPGATQ